jgi:hypothetical protein
MTSTVELNLGIDFGTRYTKVCVRNTDTDESWVVRIGKARTLVDQGLILSQVAIQNDGKLLGGFTDDEWEARISKSSLSVVIDFIKMRLAQLDPKREASNWYTSALPKFKDINLANPDILENLCAYFLYRIILRTKKWIQAYNAEQFKNVDIQWSANIGVPVEYCDSPALERFRRILYLAWHLCEKVPNHAGMTIFDLNSHLQRIRQQDFTSTPCFAIPEIAGAIYSYTVSRQAKTGIYIFFDIGGGTIEGVAFRFHRNNGMPKIDFLAGLVEPIGVNAIAKQVVSDSLELESRIERSIVLKSLEILISIEKESSKHRQPKKGEKTYYVNKHKAMLHSIKDARAKLHRVRNLKHYFILTLMMCQLLLHRQVSHVFRTCYEKLPKKENVSVFLGGGGMISEYYKDTILSTYEAFNFNRAGIPEFKMLDVPLPIDFDMSGIDQKHFHRFSIAYGLSIPDYQAPQFNLPKQFPEHTQPPSLRIWTPETSHDDG